MSNWIDKAGEAYRAFRFGMTSGKATLVLATSYGLIIDQWGHEKMRRMGLQWGDIYNENEMAVKFLIDYLEDADPSDANAKFVVSGYVRQAKLAKERGLIHSDNDDLLERFLEVAKSRFKVDATAI